MVESAESGSSDLNQVIRKPINVEEIVFSDADLGKVTVWVGGSLLGMESSSRTQIGVVLSSLQQKLEAVDEDIGGFRINRDLH